MISARELAPENAASPIDVSWLPISNVTIVSAVCENAPTSMILTFAGIVMDVSELAHKNADSPISHTNQCSDYLS